MAENYQLKWHSHGSYLHSSVATLQRSHFFTDVTLCTADGKCLSAHRFILSACSQYFEKMLQNAHMISHVSHLIIVLPTEISFRTLSVLVQYMYTGEATVNNNHLNSILKAGEVLQIRGLFQEKNKQTKDQYGAAKTTRITVQQDANAKENSSSTYQQSSNNKNRKEKRVVKEPSKDHLSTSTYRSTNNPTVVVEFSNTNNTIDSASAINTKQKPNDSMIGTILVSNSFFDTTVNGNSQNTAATVNKSFNGNSFKITRQKQRQRPPEQAKADHEFSKLEIHEIVDEEEEELPKGLEDGPETEIIVKEEPIQWKDMYNSDYDGNMPMQPEISYGSTDEQDDTESPFYAPLTCDICKETFTSPSLWVRHTQTHEDLASGPPRKKSKVNDNHGKATKVKPLSCELCQQTYESPSDWVKHIQGSHTEEQLAFSNMLCENGFQKIILPRRRKDSFDDSKCNVCKKTFTSHASMMIHIRTHTGEKPFLCAICNKGFNVKSNLLRHMRTLHDSVLENPQTIK